MEKATRINAIEGFGPGTSTGLAMLAHPVSFAVWNQQSKGAFKKIGLESNELAAFEDAASRLKEQLGAEDFLELDHFLYLVNQGRIRISGSETSIASETVETEPVVRYWAISLGEGGRLFKQCVQDGVIAIGWDHLGSLDQYPTREDMTRAIAELRGDGITPHNDSLACFQFRDEIKPGDIFFAKRGRNLILGCGRVESAYAYDPKRPEYRHTHKVAWLAQGSWTIPEDAHVPTKTLTEVTEYLKFLAFALPLLEAAEPEPPAEPSRKTYTIEQAIDGLFLTKDEFQRILRSLSRKKNAILQGPPGVGKSFIARRLAYALIGAEDPTKVATVQFHQSYEITGCLMA
jgi:5-methylcytosine-specific restriction protein B